MLAYILSHVSSPTPRRVTPGDVTFKRVSPGCSAIIVQVHTEFVLENTLIPGTAPRGFRNTFMRIDAYQLRVGLHNDLRNTENSS